MKKLKIILAVLINCYLYNLHCLSQNCTQLFEKVTHPQCDDVVSGEQGDGFSIELFECEEMFPCNIESIEDDLISKGINLDDVIILGGVVGGMNCFGYSWWTSQGGDYATINDYFAIEYSSLLDCYKETSSEKAGNIVNFTAPGYERPVHSAIATNYTINGSIAYIHKGGGGSMILATANTYNLFTGNEYKKTTIYAGLGPKSNGIDIETVSSKVNKNGYDFKFDFCLTSEYTPEPFILYFEWELTLEVNGSNLVFNGIERPFGCNNIMSSNYSFSPENLDISTCSHQWDLTDDCKGQGTISVKFAVESGGKVYDRRDDPLSESFEFEIEEYSWMYDYDIEQEYNLNKNNFISNKGYYYARDYIKAENITITRPVEFAASNFIELKKGFVADKNNTFTAYLKNMECKCDEYGNKKKSAIYNSIADNNENTLPEKNELNKDIFAKDVSVYPNPSSGIINVNINDNIVKNAIIYINNIYGKTVYKQKVNSTTTNIDLSDNPKGIYILSVIAPENILLQKKIILE